MKCNMAFFTDPNTGLQMFRSSKQASLFSFLVIAGGEELFGRWRSIRQSVWLRNGEVTHAYSSHTLSGTNSMRMCVLLIADVFPSPCVGTYWMINTPALQVRSFLWSGRPLRFWTTPGLAASPMCGLTVCHFSRTTSSNIQKTFSLYLLMRHHRNIFTSKTVTFLSVTQRKCKCQFFQAVTHKGTINKSHPRDFTHQCKPHVGC